MWFCSSFGIWKKFTSEFLFIVKFWGCVRRPWDSEFIFPCCRWRWRCCLFFLSWFRGLSWSFELLFAFTSTFCRFRISFWSNSSCLRLTCWSWFLSFFSFFTKFIHRLLYTQFRFCAVSFSVISERRVFYRFEFSLSQLHGLCFGLIISAAIPSCLCLLQTFSPLLQFPLAIQLLWELTASFRLIF